MRTIVLEATDGVRIVADVDGLNGADTVVLAHGGGQTRHAWSGAARALAGAGYRVINFDARGHGDSDWSPDHSYPAERRWGDMAMILSHATGRTAIVGASMGGGTALSGLSRGFQPAALVLVDIAPNASRIGMAHVRDFMRSGLAGFASLEDAANAVAAYMPYRAPPKDLSGLKKNLRLGEDGIWRWHWDPGMVQLDIDEERAMLALSMEALRGVSDMPLLLVRGLQSDVVTDETVQEFRACVPALEVIDIGGAGHMVAGDRNDAFIEAIIDFLGRSIPKCE